MTRLNDWNGRDGSFWADRDERYDALLAPLSRHLLSAAAIGPAERVLDVGCGCGNTTRSAGRAAPDGSALGVDLSEPMLAKARRRTAEAGLTNVEYEQADAQHHPFGTFDLVMSQFGVMFFDDPVAAFTNLRRTGGRLAFLCWGGVEENENRMVKRTAMSPYVTVPPVVPGVGAMSLAEPERIHEVLTAAGFVGIELADVREPLLIGRTAEEAVEVEVRQPTVADWFAEAGPEAAARATEALHAAYAARATPDGVLMGSAAWLVTAR